jgi:outer membrane biogenesis lipoprotein LolB
MKREKLYVLGGALLLLTGCTSSREELKACADRDGYYSLQWKPRPGAEADGAFTGIK